MNYNYPLQYLEVFLPKMYKFLVENVYFQFLLMNFQGQIEKIVNNTRNT